MAEIVAGTGWQISRFIEAADGPDYTAVLQKA
jgi:hypothetical protein